MANTWTKQNSRFKQTGPAQEHKRIQAFITSEWQCEPKLTTAAAVLEAIASSNPLPGNIVQVNEAEATDIQDNYQAFAPSEALTMCSTWLAEPHESLEQNWIAGGKQLQVLQTPRRTTRQVGQLHTKNKHSKQFKLFKPLGVLRPAQHGSLGFLRTWRHRFRYKAQKHTFQHSKKQCQQKPPQTP